MKTMSHPNFSFNSDLKQSIFMKQNVAEKIFKRLVGFVLYLKFKFSFQRLENPGIDPITLGLQGE